MNELTWEEQQAQRAAELRKIKAYGTLASAHDFVIVEQSQSLVFGSVTIHADGRVEFAPGVTPNEAAKQFAEALQGYVEWRWKCGGGGKQ